MAANNSVAQGPNQAQRQRRGSVIVPNPVLNAFVRSVLGLALPPLLVVMAVLASYGQAGLMLGLLLFGGDALLFLLTIVPAQPHSQQP